jgi:GH3 auxin-responsive promoter
VIERVGGAALRVYAAHRRRALEGVARDAGRVQEAALLDLVNAARETAFGRSHRFEQIRSVADYQARTPLGDYLRFQPLWTRAINGERDLTWPGRPRYWAKTSGTTAGDKMIPVTPEAFRAHRKGGWDALLIAAERAGFERVAGGPLLFLGGCTSLKPVGQGCWVGDLSGLMVQDLPPGFRSRYSPGREVASISDWDQRIDAVAELIQHQDLRLISGMPSWLLILFERVARARRAAGRPVASLGECWSNLGALIHGGVSFAPYRATVEEWMGRPIEYVEVYPASEGFVGLQTERTGGLTLMLDYGIFYEFVPVEDLGRARPRRHTVAEVELDRPYAVALTTPGGLWSYLLGDTVRFTARDPLRLAITGRTRHFVNAFGENVIIEEVEQALVVACRRTGAEPAEFTVAPRYPSAGEARGGHEWLVEFRIPPRDRKAFVRGLDEALAALNTDYRTKRTDDVGMVAPRLVEMPSGSFHRWMREAGKLGEQHKVPRVLNDRAVAEALLATVDAREREPLVHSMGS